MWRAILLLFLSSCAPSSVEDFRYEAQAECRRFVKELRKIETKEELEASLPKIKKRYERMADLIVALRKKKPSDAELPEPTLEGEELFTELARLYEIPGCKELMETAQSEAIQRL